MNCMCEKIREHEMGVEGDELINGAVFTEDTIPFLPPRQLQHEQEGQVPVVREVHSQRVSSESAVE